jgi:small-conductance mechanosensitive channel
MILIKVVLILSFFLETLSVSPQLGIDSNGGLRDAVEDAVEDILEGVQNVVVDVVDDILEGAQNVGSFLKDEIHRTFLAGNILPALDKLHINPEKFHRISNALAKVSDWRDFAFLITLAYAIDPALQFPYNLFSKKKKRYVDTVYHVVADHLQQVSRIALLCYLVDLMEIVVIEMGFKWDLIPRIPNLFAKSAYTLWIARRIAVSKKWLLCKMAQRQPEQLGRMELLDHLADAIIIMVVILALIGHFKHEMGFALKSIFALGSVGTLVFSLASQGIVANLMNGLLLSASDRVYEGDSVIFGNGIEGTIVDLGWLATLVRQNDEVMLTVPNSDLASEKLSNLSRMSRCQVKQVLRIDYKDVDKLPRLCEDIKSEIRASCPALILDGSRPLRAHWVGYEDLYLKVVIEAHFNIRPVGDEYWANRQRTLQAINRAAKKNAITFVTTA